LFIASPFPVIGRWRRNDANGLDWLTVFGFVVAGMGDQKEEMALHPTERLPALARAGLTERPIQYSKRRMLFSFRLRTQDYYTPLS
jgi:hypothetical protein